MDKCFFDVLGNTVLVGDFIAYGVRSGNSGGMGVGRVLSIEVEERSNRDGSYTWKSYGIKVRGFEMQTYGDNKGQYRICRPGVLNSPDRIVRIQEDDLPEGVMALYEPA